METPLNKPNTVAIVDYGICNMFSVKHACERAGLHASITASVPEIAKADIVILPGVGAFGDAMDALRKLDLIHPLKDIIQSGKTFVGICLGYQLLFTESQEFEMHKGLDIISGSVERFQSTEAHPLKVPHVGWNQIARPTHADWKGTPLSGVTENEYVYFCHSFHIVTDEADVPLTTTQYGPHHFTSSIRKGNIFGFQFHPEKSGHIGTQIYQNIAFLAQNLK